MSDTVCIYHSPCVDGFASAWVVDRYYRYYLHEPLDFVAGKYGEVPPDVTDKDVILLDFTYKRPVLEEMLEKCHSMLILDHHKSAREDLQGLVHPKLKCIFDMNRSGAGIAWDYFLGSDDESLPGVLAAVQDRDLWKFELADTHSICEAVDLADQTFKAWDGLVLDTNSVDLVAQGAVLRKRKELDVARLVHTCAMTIELDGQVVPCANVPYMYASDVGNELAKDAPFAVTYFDTLTGRKFSLRSRVDGGTDVSKIAVKYGGGGHKNAAGFEGPVPALGVPAPLSIQT